MNKHKNWIPILCLLLSACASREENRFSKQGREEILLDGESVDAKKIEVRNTKSLDHVLVMEQVKREAAEKRVAFWHEEYQSTKQELQQARVLLGLPPERPTGCNPWPCKEGEVRPSMTISEELQTYRQKQRRIPSGGSTDE